MAVVPLLAACEDKSAPPPPAPAKTTAAATAPSPATPAPAPATGPAKTYDCGGHDQKPCPMQGWMKRTMAPASMDGDGEALAKALTYVADHAPPGYPEWATIAKTGAAKAKAGDIDGAKNACKQCHDTYKAEYKSTMRDRPF